MAKSQQIRKWVRSGAMHPIVLVENPLRESIKTHHLPQVAELSAKPFPWPDNSHSAHDCVAKVLHDHVWHVAQSTEHYYNLREKVLDRVFFSQSIDKNH